MTDTRTRRLKALSDLLRTGTVGSQEDATEQLRSLGFEVTQATVSRDIDHLGALKVKREGLLAYALPDQLGASDWSAGRLERILLDWALSIESTAQMIVIKTPPGSAHLVASSIDQANLPEIAGTIAGDDTLFLAVRDGAKIRSLVRRFEQIIGHHKGKHP